VFVLDSETSECLHYEPAFAYPKKRLAKIPREVLASHKEVEIRYDLLDCSIDICSVEVSLSVCLSVCRPSFNLQTNTFSFR
jgi:translation initiation factor eIF-2B subunit epsilon